jgi:Ran GTPase-activating protein 1
MQDFRMVSSRVGLDGGIALCNALAGGSALESIDISDNPMEPAIGKNLAALTLKHRGLKRLILNDLCLGDEGITMLCAPLAQADSCPELEHLELSLNEISRASSPTVAQALVAKRKTLRIVVLSENELECAGAIHIATGLQGTRALEELNLSTNQIGRVGALAVAKTCALAPNLKMLTLNDNVVSDEGVDEVRCSCVFPPQFWLRRMWWSNASDGDDSLFRVDRV